MAKGRDRETEISRDGGIENQRDVKNQNYTKGDIER